MKKIFTHLFAVLLLSLVTTSAWAQLTELEEGAVYRFVNRSTGRALNAGESSGGTLYVNATTVAADDLKQQWYVTKSGDYYVLRNLYYAKYLNGAITNKVPWSLTDYDSASSNLFSLVISATSYNTLETKDWTNYGFMHDDGISYNGGYRVVSWENGDGSNSSHWTIHKVEYTAEALKEVLEAHPTTEEVLTEQTDNFVSLFNEGACYTPKYSTLDEAKATAEYLALEDEIRELADKIYTKALTTDGWAEDNADAEKTAAGLNWDAEYAKKFRVQMYEPYSIAGDITGFLRMNAHANNDNPTGIYVPEGGVVYVMVEGEIKDGATLRLIDAGSNGRITEATTGGYELNTGLNIIRYAEEAGMLYICYNVDTYDPNGESEEDKFPHKLSEYPPLKIHIEGGAINGFYSSCGDYLANKTYEGVTYNEDLWGGVDDDNDWIYMEERANLSVLPIISHRQILLFQLNEENGQQGMKHFLPESVSVPETPFSYPQNGETSSWDDYDAYGMDCNITTGKINIWMETWDRIMHAELATLGLISEDDVNKMNEFYPRWKSDGTKAEIYDMTNAGSDGKTYKMFCNGRDYSEYYNHHGVSLGTTSGYMSAGWNAANYNNSTFGELMGMPTSGGLWGPVHEIGHQFQDVFNIRGATEVTNNVFSNAATWYQGISTSRYNGGNLTTTLDNFNSGLPFVDYNIWSMTQMFYKLWLYYHLAGNNTQFYPRFFEMLRVDPLNAKNATATGTESMLKIYEKMCDASGEDLTEFFRAHGFFVLLDNYAKEDYGITVFTQTQEEVDAAIERVKSKGYKENLAVILINDGAEATLRHDGKTPRSFFDGTANPEYGGVNDFIDGSATAGGAYTAMVNSDGTMTMIGNGGIGFLVFDENGNIISFNDNPTFALSDEAKEAILTGNATIVSVGSDINVEPVVAEIDLTAMQKAILGELIAKAQAIIDKVDDTYKKIGYYKGAAVADLAAVLANAKTVYESASGYEAAYDLLYAEYHKVLANPDAKIPFDPSLTYIITNKEYTNQTMWVNSSKVVRSEGGVDQTVNAAKWQFKDAGTTGVYNIYNLSGYYCPAVEQSTSMTAIETLRPDTIDGLYTLQEMETGVWAIKLSPAAGYRNFHSSGSNVVGWETGSNASRWYLTAVAPNATIADLTNLEVYITKTEALLGEVLGTVTYTKGENITLQTTTEGSAGYIWSNAPCATEGTITNLVDGATNNYFHTEWDGDAVTSGDHYIAVDLGAGNTLPRFAFSHTTRSGAQNDFPKSVDVYGSDDNVTYKYLGSASDMPQSAGTSWQFDGMIISSHRYLRFNMHANRGYWHMAEFDIMPVTGFTATVNDTYSATVNVATVTTAMEALYNGKGVALSMSPTKETIAPVLEALETAYKALYEQYEATINARKETLAQLVTATQNLIDQTGTVAFAQEIPVALTSSNFYCNSVDGDGGATADNKYNLADGNESTYLHTKTNNHTGEDSYGYHYLRVDLGDGVTTENFMFTYQNRTPSDYAVFPSVLTIQGSNDNSEYVDIVEISSGLPNTAGGTYESEVLGNGNAYRYFRFVVKSTHENRSTPNYFCMAEFDFIKAVPEKTTVYSTYQSVVPEELLLSSVHTTNSSNAMSTNALVTSVPLLDAQIADQQAAYNKLYAAMNNTAALKANLKELIDNTQALYDKMADDEGNVNSNYSVSALENQDLVDALAQITAAQLVFENASATVESINTAYETLNEKYQVLLKVENANEKGSLATTELETLIDNTKILLGNIATEEVSNVGIALQIDNETAPYYIWSNAPADDCNEYSNKVQGLIDTNDDGSAKTGTFFGTDWGSSVPAYTHYIEIDMGVSSVLENLSVDYTTRESGAEDSRPNGLKFFGSNNKVDYEEFYSVTTGLPADANTKWAMSAPVELVKNYRYIRIAVSSPHGSCFNMADFNVYTNINYSLNEYYTTATGLGFEDLCLALQSAEDVVARAYLTTAQYNAVFEKLNTCYTTANNVVNDDVTAGRSELSGLIDITKELLALVSTDDDTEFEIPLQCTNVNDAYYLYCNAPGKTNTTWNTTDSTGVKSLLDDNADTYLHTTYEGNDYADDLDHYLRLDMGKEKALVSFKFDYVGRVNNTGNAPTAIKIEGSNDCENFEEITTLTGLPTANNATYESGEITNGKAYRYIRFMVTATSNGADYNEHPYFALSHFAVTAGRVIAINEEYVTPNLPLKVVTDAYNEVYEANNVVNHYTMSESNLSVAESELQAAYNALNLAKNLKELPVTLTTDQNNPVLYKIRINRGSTKLLQYDTKTAKVAVADEDLGNEYQAWYFMQGTDGNGYDDVLIYPYWGTDAANTTLRLGSNSITDGNSKVSAVDGTDDTYKQNWYITFTEGTTAEGWLNIQPEGKATYFSNHGGTAEKMGFLNKADDDGSEFRFVLDETDYSLSDAYYALLKQYNAYGDVEAGTAVGTYTTESVNAYMEKYNAAGALVEAKNATDDEYNAAREELVTAYEALKINMPDPAKYYVLRCNHEDRYIYVNADNKLQWAASSYDKAQSRAVWQFEEIDANSETCKMKSLHTQSYMQTVSSGNQVVFGTEGAIVTITPSGSVDGAVVFEAGNNNIGLHAHGSENRVIGYGNGAGANHYFFEEVEDVTSIKHDVTMTAKFSSVMLGYNATVPAGVKAYIATGIDGGYVSLEEVAVPGETLPAGTPVILYRTDDETSKVFTYSEETPVSVDDESVLGGSLYTKYVKCDDDKNYYKLMLKGGEAKMYWMWKEFNALGQSQGANDDGGHIKCSANKIYMALPNSGGNPVAMYGMRFVDDSATGLEEMKGESGEVKAIYDLQGRKLSEITEPGMYIVDGKKVYVK